MIAHPHHGAFANDVTVGNEDYIRFLEAKRPPAVQLGVPLTELPALPTHLVDGRPIKDHQTAIVRWAIVGGRRAIFARFGLGKSIMQLLTLSALIGSTGRALLVAPLGVRTDLMRDAAAIGLSLRFIRSDAEVDGPGLYLTNYEPVRDGKLDPARFGAASLDVVHDKAAYTRARWQLDAHAFWRSAGDRLLTPDELLGLPAKDIYRRFRAHSIACTYDFRSHVAVGQALEDAKSLPPGFMLLPPQSWHEDVWTDVTRMRTLNGAQHAKGREMHLCPLQFDIVDRLIETYSQPGETVFDPFGGLMTVPLRAIQLGRRGLGCELNGAYFLDGVRYLEDAERDLAVPSLFDLMTVEAAEQPPSEHPILEGEQ